MSVTVDFNRWGQQALAPGEEVSWWYTWIFDESHWSRMSAVPDPWTPENGSIQIVKEWATNGTLRVQWRNSGTDYVYWHPTVIVAPGRY